MKVKFIRQNIDSNYSEVLIALLPSARKKQNKSYLKMQFIGKPTSRPRTLRKSIEKQKW